MPDQGSAADEHAILQEVTAPLATLPDDALPIAADADFPIVLRGYDRIAVDAYVKRTSQLVAELQATRSPEAAVRRALERMGEQISGVLQRAHDTAEQITVQSRREAEERLQLARQEAHQITASAEDRLKELDVETDRIWAERHRIVDDARDLARQLLALAEEAVERFPPADTSEEEAIQVVPPPFGVDPVGDQEPPADEPEQDEPEAPAVPTDEAPTQFLPPLSPEEGDAPHDIPNEEGHGGPPDEGYGGPFSPPR
jgi:hypothetical protein